jgi:hypothetical protein
MVRVRVDESKLSHDELVRRAAVLAAAKLRAERYRAGLRARQNASQRAGAVALENLRGQDNDSAVTTVYDPVQLSEEELAVANEIIEGALKKVRFETAGDALLALIKTQETQIKEAQRMGDMPNWYGQTQVTLFVQPPYERSRLPDNDPERPRIKNLIDFQRAGVARLSPEALQALREFQDGVRWNVQSAMGVYQPINRLLRGIGEPTYSKWQSEVAVQNVNRNMHLMDAAFNDLVVPENIYTFRGIRGPDIYPNKATDHAGNFARDFASWRVGEVRSDGGFVSTTLSRRVANEMFTSGHDNGNTEPYVLEYRVPAGTRAIAMNAVNPDSKYANTVELIIGRDTQFRVIAKYDDTGRDGRVIHRAVLDILPPQEQAGRTPLPVYRLTGQSRVE